MRYCKSCVLPDTRPGITIGKNGICLGCESHKEKDHIDWLGREHEFRSIVTSSKKKAKGYECVIPVSGGKDSTAQVIKCLEYGLKILTVTWKTPVRTEVGQKNLDNLIGLGVDHLEFTINPQVERKFMYRALVEKGDPGLPMHMAIYSIPLRVATLYNIPLVIWGESPHMEYGGSKKDRRCNILDSTWLKKHGIIHGTSISHWVGNELSQRDLEVYRLPSDKKFHDRKILSIFLGYYFRWDPEENFCVALKHGFKIREEGPKTGYYSYADIDCDFISVHHYFKWLKFGFTRLFDNLSIEIRNGRMSRSGAIKIIKDRGEEAPREDIKKMCEFLHIKESEFYKIVEKFRNKKIWTRKDGKWIIKDFLIKDWRW